MIKKTDQKLGNENLYDIYEKLYKERKKSNLSDKDFSILNFNVALRIVGLLKRIGIKITYNRLTNLNFHFLVKILNYNDVLTDLTKKEKEELKKLPLIK